MGVWKDDSNVDRPVHVSVGWNRDEPLADELVDMQVRFLARLGAVGDAFAGAAFLRRRAAAHAALDVGVRGLITSSS